MSAFVLKLIAVCCMLIDHTAASVPVQLLVTQFGWDALILRSAVFLLRCVGRLAFPIFAFFIAEGCRHTHSPKRYLGRLLLFGLLSELPFRVVVLYGWRPIDWASFFSRFSLENVFFTLALGALSCFLCGLLRDRGRSALSLLPVLPLAALAQVLSTDYGALGVLLIFAAYACPGKRSRLAAMAAVLTLEYAAVPFLQNPGIPPSYLLYWLSALLALIPLAFYNGQRGKPVKWAFYAFYPVHLSLLAFILTFWVQPMAAALY